MHRYAQQPEMIQGQDLFLFGLGAKFGRQRLVEIGLAEQGFFIALVVDLMDK
jgi:hypothetical protein